MFGYTKRHEDAQHERTLAPCSASKTTNSWWRIASIFIPVILATLLLGTQVGHVSANAHAPQNQIAGLEQQVSLLTNNDAMLIVSPRIRKLEQQMFSLINNDRAARTPCPQMERYPHLWCTPS